MECYNELCSYYISLAMNHTHLIWPKLILNKGFSASNTWQDRLLAKFWGGARACSRRRRGLHCCTCTYGMDYSSWQAAFRHQLSTLIWWLRCMCSLLFIRRPYVPFLNFLRNLCNMRPSTLHNCKTSIHITYMLHTHSYVVPWQHKAGVDQKSWIKHAKLTS